MKIKCVDSGGTTDITEGYVYDTTDSDRVMYFITTDSGEQRAFHKSRFEVLKDNKVIL